MLSSSFLLALTAGLDHGQAENNERNFSLQSVHLRFGLTPDLTVDAT
jgi:hypothetical protein